MKRPFAKALRAGKLSREDLLAAIEALGGKEAFAKWVEKKGLASREKFDAVFEAAGFDDSAWKKLKKEFN